MGTKARKSAPALERGIGARVRDQRQRQALTQVQLAAAAGLSQPHIARIEAGIGDLSLDALGRVAAALGLSPAALLADPGDR